jgi:hypothetical protein
MDTVVDATGQRFRTASGKDYTEWTFFGTPWDYREFINL